MGFVSRNDATLYHFIISTIWSRKLPITRIFVFFLGILPTAFALYARLFHFFVKGLEQINQNSAF